MIKGSLKIANELTLNGMVTDDVTVQAGGHLVVHGMCCRDLVLERGSRVELHGMVVGNVVNCGGVLAVYGMINGSLFEEAGETLISPAAKVLGQARS
jgi:hypothetical protein